MRRLLLHLPGAGDAVVVRVGLALLDELGGEHVDGGAVLGVHHREQPVLGGGLHRADDLSVIRVEDARVGHEHLVARDALVGEGRHRLERGLVDAAEDLVEAVVDRAVARCLLVPFGEAVLDAGAGGLHGEVDDGCRAAPGCGARPRLEGVGRLGAAEGELEVGVRVDAAGDDVLAGRVDDGVGRGLEVGAERVRAGLEQGDDLLAVDEHVGIDAPGGGDDGSAGDEGGAHCFLRWSNSGDRVAPRAARRVSRSTASGCWCTSPDDGRGRTASRRASAAPCPGRCRGSGSPRRCPIRGPPRSCRAGR